MNYKIGATGVAAAALIAYSGYANMDDGSQLFLNESIGADQLQFMNFIQRFSKSYGTKEEYLFRFEQFKRQIKLIAEHDEVYYGTTMGLNEHSDKTEAEWKKMLGLVKLPENLEEGYEPTTDEVNLHMPRNFDWRDYGAVTRVKNQGACGSCWTYSTIAGIEFAWWKVFKQAVSFSEQNIADCIRN